MEAENAVHRAGLQLRDGISVPSAGQWKLKT